MKASASLNNVPTSPRKMRLVADMVRGESVVSALNILKHESKQGAKKIEQLLLSAISNWQNKYEDQNLEEADLFVETIKVDSARMLKRIQPAPQGRAHRIRKRSNHITIVVESRKEDLVADAPIEEVQETEENK